MVKKVRRVLKVFVGSVVLKDTTGPKVNLVPGAFLGNTVFWGALA